MTRILRRLCGEPVRQRGSHKFYERTQDGRTYQVLFSYHDGATVTGGIVRQILRNDLGLTREQARKAVKKK
ncbi:type II toxin-antitoxin system HicA family toxin [Tomitella gaofuii]|uniref:type II toxin-antitoxin system HicA family toxin n=1 Tax=Tomitella gaofuii TaxID=2760083 RepID=UPI0035584286